jgi:radical SAM protein with 4Fe4S-binding SPASM domain
MIGEVPLGVLQLEVTRACPRRCAFCYVRPDAPDLPGGGGPLPAATLADHALTVARAEGVRRVQLSGGEPLQHPELLPLIDALREGGLSVSLLTDGQGLDAERARALAARGVSPLQPTLLSGSAPVHDGLRGPGAFADATRAIAEAAAVGMEVSVSFVITAANWAEATGAAELAFALGARTFALSRFCPVGTAASRELRRRLLPRATQVRHATEAAAAACRELGLAVAAAITVPRCVWSDPARPPVPTGVCSLMGDRATVTLGPDGSVRSCALSHAPVGRLGDAPWPVLAQRLWERELRPLRDRLPRACQACAHLPACRGGCRLAGQAVGPDGLDPLARP